MVQDFSHQLRFLLADEIAAPNCGIPLEPSKPPRKIFSESKKYHNLYPTKSKHGGTLHFRYRYLQYMHIPLYLEPEESIYDLLFNFMIQNDYIENICLTRHPFKTGCFDFQVDFIFAFSKSFLFFKDKPSR